MLIQVTTSLCYDPRFISLKEKPTSFLSSLLYSISSSSYVHFLYSAIVYIASSLDIMGRCSGPVNTQFQLCDKAHAHTGIELRATPSRPCPHTCEPRKYISSWTWQPIKGSQAASCQKATHPMCVSVCVHLYTQTFYRVKRIQKERKIFFNFFYFL
jgi:hypothetical protein